MEKDPFISKLSDAICSGDPRAIGDRLRGVWMAIGGIGFIVLWPWSAAIGIGGLGAYLTYKKIRKDAI